MAEMAEAEKEVERVVVAMAVVAKAAVVMVMHTERRFAPRQGSRSEMSPEARSSRTNLSPRSNQMQRVRTPQAQSGCVHHTQQMSSSCSLLLTGQSRFGKVKAGPGNSHIDCR